MTKDISEMVRTKATSVVNLFKLLKDVVKAPESIEKPLRDALLPALTSQGMLAALCIPEAAIVGMSLNTHKAIANELEQLDGGYAALNDYRKAALSKLKDVDRIPELPGRGTIDWYKNELEEKNKELSCVANDIALMGLKLNDVLLLAHDMARKANQEEDFYKRRSEILRKFKP
ncbi:hypothetical protein [Paraburkholderia sp. RL18-085-BIA-A]|uniref:hypothetical protein n=1 Tax=Paraburkholderia sp. RL18-085-BIA-A TaxID=3031633 RepID=UPI0038BBE111